MRIVRHNERQPRFLGKSDQLVVDLRLLGKSVVLKLQIVVLGSENFSMLECSLFCPFVVPLHQKLRQFPGQARRERDNSLVMRAQKLHVDTRAVIKAVQKAARDHVAEVPVARLVFAQQNEMIRLFIQRMDLVKAGPRRDIDLAADDGLDACRLCRLIKVDRAIHDAVVRDGNRVLPQLLDSCHNFRDAARAVKKAILRMDMQMDKAHRFIPPMHAPAPEAFACGG